MLTSDISLEDRLRLEHYDAAECSAAIRGEKAPFALGLPVTRLCVLRGIRYHAGFAIMSNVIPDMTSPDEFPYCIWHPDLAAEETYRELARRYPLMRYHVGRACAAAGYLDLYCELKLLPDVSIAEEARDNQKDGDAIFREIMAQPVKYAVMDDYIRSVNLANPRAGACLNGDTAVRSLLEVKQKHVKPMRDLFPDLYLSRHDESSYFNTTEDWGIDDYNSEPPDHSAVVPPLYSPLPTDLPPVNKDLLILLAAYSGNIDRYARLRRPQMIPGEYSCIVRGIYHDAIFAKCIRRAINARFIMNNDLSRITEETDEGDLPYLIWYPSWADATPDYFLVEEARASHNPYYLEDLLRQAAQMHIDIFTPPSHDSWKGTLLGETQRTTG
ncbi:hypothetical protein M432DRAFT_663869 [Thermoascus aurantiacus ATCC 26904]